MTIIEPNKRRSKLKWLIFPVILVIFAGAYFSIAIYNTTVNLKHLFKTREAELRHLQIINVELRNRLYALLDAHNLRTAAEALGLVLEKNPSYLETGTNNFATNL